MPLVMIMAGGTGGHIFPGLAVAESLKARGASVSWLGTPHGLENRLVPEAGIELDRIGIRGLRGRGLLGWLLAPFNIVRAMWQARCILRARHPDCVLCLGGYAAGPGGLAARVLGIPLVVHEQNAVAGLTNRVLAGIAARVFTGFPGALKGGEVSGNPVRAEIASIPAPEQRFSQRTGRLRLLVIGGSQGAAVFNDTVPAALARLPVAQRPEVLHQTGNKQHQQTLENYKKAGVEADVVAFVDDMAAAWAGADLAICRAGALTVAELAAAGVPSLLVPFPHAVDDHQTMNAHYLTEGGAAWALPQAGFTAEAVAAILEKADRAALLAMARSARARALPDAAEIVARGCLEVAS